MKVTILMEDTCGNCICEYEHGLSVYFETENHKILADTGASSKTIENAKRLGISLADVDTVFLSHGHYDHSGGIRAFVEMNPKADIYMQRSALGEFYHGERYIGIDKKIISLPTVKVLDGEVRISQELSVFAGITGRRNWPQGNRSLSVKKGEQFVQDEFKHEQCLVIKGEKTVLFSGCAHNGILNILDRYSELYGGCPNVVISGFHMVKKTEYTEEEEETIRNTARELAKLPIRFYSGHCTGEKAMNMMQEIMGNQLVWMRSGMEMEIEKCKA